MKLTSIPGNAENITPNYSYFSDNKNHIAIN
jgi:hypothetical protein